MSDPSPSPDSKEHFLQVAIRPFRGNAELEIAAERELRDAIENASTPIKCDTLDECAKRLEASPGRKGAWTCLAMALASLSLVAWTAWTIHRDWDWLKCMADVMDFPDRDLIEPYLAKSLSLSPKQQLLLFGDPSLHDTTGRFEKLWKSQPDRIDLFQEYATLHLAEKQSLPPDFRQVVDRLDPDNGYFALMEATASGGNSVESLPLPHGKLPRPLPPASWDIKDRSKMDEAIRHIEKAVTAPRIQSYSGQLQLERLAILPPATGQTDRVARTFYFSYTKSGAADFLGIAKIVAAKAELCGKESDPEGLRRLIATWKRFEDKLYPQIANSMVLVLVSRTSSVLVRQNMAATATALGMDEEAKRLGATIEKLESLNRERQDPARQQRVRQLRERAAYLLSVSSILEKYRPASKPAPSPEEMKPGRMVDYAVADRIGAAAAWVILLPSAIFAALYRFRSGFLCRKLSGRLDALLTPSDRFLIISSGIAPLIALLVLGQSPMGGRQWSLAVHSMTLPIGQILATILLMIVLPRIVARRRISRRGAQLGLAGKTSPLDWLTVILCIASVIVLGITPGLEAPRGERHFFPEMDAVDLDLPEARDPYKAWLFTAASLLSLATLCLLLQAGIAIFGKHSKALRRAVASRALAPAYFAGMLAFSLTIPLHLALERYWIARDHLYEITPASVPQNTYDRGAITDAKDELLKTLQSGD